MKNFKSFLITALLLIAQAAPSFAQRILDSSFYQWRLYEIQDDELDDKKCYMVAHPVKTQSDNHSRKRPYMMITHYQNLRTEEFSVYSGFEYKINGKILISIDDIKFELLTNKDMAWAKNQYDDASIIQIMLDSEHVKVRADSANGTFSVDEYSLKGIAKAYNRLREICK